MSTAAPAPAIARESAKRYLLGTHRICAPETTWLNIQPILSSFGITRVADVTGLDVLGVPVYQAVRPASRNISVSQGKGVTQAAARVSAAMEALELAHAECVDELELHTASLTEMRRRQPRLTRELDWAHGPREFDDRPLTWLRAVSPRTGAEAWLPREMIELDFSRCPEGRSHWFRRTSNGLASGNNYEEALAHALGELVERHALALAQRETARRRALDPDTIDDPAALGMIARLRAAGCKLALYEVTCEMGVPVIAVELVLEDLPRIWGGSGCHLSPVVATLRALTEAAQSRLTYLSGARDDLEIPLHGTTGAELYAHFEEPRRGLPFEVLSDQWSEDLAEDVATLAECLSRAGHPPVVVDLSRPCTGISVVRAFAPGLLEAIDA